jgi:hypothetical protein
MSDDHRHTFSSDTVPFLQKSFRPCVGCLYLGEPTMSQSRELIECRKGHIIGNLNQVHFGRNQEVN